MAETSNCTKQFNALVTGITGNIGTACEKYLTTRAWFVHGIARTSRRDATAYNVKQECFDLNKSWNEITLWCNANKYKYDLVVMAHGVQKPATLQTMTEDQWYSIFYGNLSSCIGLTHALVKANKLNDNALIVYCSSIQANTPRAGRGLYAACKAGLEAFSKTVAVELAPHTRSIALRLGQLTTTMGGIAFTSEERSALEQRALVPWVAPDDVASFIFELYQQKSMTGCVIDFDSGHGRNVW